MKTSGLGDRFFVSGYDISGDIGSIQTMNKTRGEQDTTGISKSAMERLALLEDGELGFNNYFTGEAAAQAHERLKGLSGIQLATYFRGAALEAAVAAVIGRQFSYNLARGQEGSALGTASMKAATGLRGLEWCRALTAGKVTVSGAGALTSAYMGWPFGSDGKLSAYLHVFGITGSAGDDITVSLEHSDYSLDDIAADDDALVLVTNLLNNHVFTLTGAGYGPDGRIVTLTIVDTNASITAGTVRVTGTDLAGAALVENIDIAGGAGAYATTNRFLTVTEIKTLNDVVTLGGSGDETIKAGVAAVSNSFSAISGAAFDEVDIGAAPTWQQIEADGPIKRHVRAVVATDDGFTTALIAVAARAYGPATS